MAFSSDGQTLAVGGSCWLGTTRRGGCIQQGGLELWDVGHRRLLGLPRTGDMGFVSSVAFGPDGKTLASSSEDSGHSIIRLWDAARRRLLGSPLNVPAYVAHVAFSPDGTTLAAGTGWPARTGDGVIQLWDVGHQESLGTLLTGLPILDLAFSPNGTTLVSGTPDGIQRWDVNAGSWERRACRIANRNLSQQEWRQYLGDLPYQKTCPDLPAGS